MREDKAQMNLALIAQAGPVDGARIAFDQDNRNTRPRQFQSGDRTGQSRPDNRNNGVMLSHRTRHFLWTQPMQAS